MLDRTTVLFLLLAVITLPQDRWETETSHHRRLILLEILQRSWSLERVFPSIFGSLSYVSPSTVDAMRKYLHGNRHLQQA